MEIFRKSEVPGLRHHFRHGLDLYTDRYISTEAADEKRWSVTVSDLQAWTCLYIYIYWTVSCALCTRNTSFFFRVLQSFGGATCDMSVWNGGRTESTARVDYLHRVLDQEAEM